MLSLPLVIILFFLIAFLYAAVGHGGASGYIALMVLMGIAPELIRPSALLLNVAVSLIASVQYYRGGHFRKELLLPFVVSSIPFSFLGASIPLSEIRFKIILGCCLLIAIGRILFVRQSSVVDRRPLPLPVAIVAGGIIGLISGMIGIGGGILLSPLLILGRWSTIKEAAAVAAPFIFLNSFSALVALRPSIDVLSLSYFWLIPAIMGGLLGSYGGSLRFDISVLRYLLAIVLLIAAGKLILP